MREPSIRQATAVILLLCASCATRSAAPYRLLPAQPDYVVEAPDSARTPFPEVLRGYTANGDGWVQLQPDMGLRLERAYFRAGAPTQDLKSYLGTETVSYRATSEEGLVRIGSVRYLAERPAGARRVDQLIAVAQLGRNYHRLFYQVLLNPTDTHRVAVLVSGDSQERMDTLTTWFIENAHGVCESAAQRCTIFPTHTSVSLEIEIFVDGAPRRVPWGSRLSSIKSLGPRPKLSRRYQQGLERVVFDPSDPATLAVPLLPGDQISR